MNHPILSDSPGTQIWTVFPKNLPEGWSGKAPWDEKDVAKGLVYFCGMGKTNSKKVTTHKNHRVC